jgi:hypothetical protein
MKDGQRLQTSSTFNGINGFAVIKGTDIKLLLWNYSDEQAFGELREIKLELKLNGTLFSKGTVNEKKYLIDTSHSNITANSYAPNLQIVNSRSFH